MERITYILGAGFSAPLGLPVVRDFVSKSKDLFADPLRFRHFRYVFNAIKRLSVIKNYVTADMYDIEEVLSLLEMSHYLQGRHLADKFVR